MRRRKYGGAGALLGIVLFVCVALWAVRGIQEAARRSDAEGLRQAEQAVRQAAVGYFALEGAYPATYQQLKDYSGLAVDEEKYVVFYEAFASNLMPDITVIERRVR
ncbi:MAG: hypothetical protein IJR48_01235 [Oscillibacter sp.]|nr:hypothetical protein [Oscillibacter sp.]MBQ9616961.1 hypothetical protein [Oscillibacter sp.]